MATTDRFIRDGRVWSDGSMGPVTYIEVKFKYAPALITSSRKCLNQSQLVLVSTKSELSNVVYVHMLPEKLTNDDDDINKQ